VVRENLDEAICKMLLNALVAWTPKWEAVYGAFRPYYYADVQSFFHDLDELPADMSSGSPPSGDRFIRPARDLREDESGKGLDSLIQRRAKTIP
jgi:hypothetical protein